MHDIQTIVIGAGAVGLAIGRELALKGREVMVLERHDLIGSETSARNSEVIHAGIYYPRGSLKARTCVEGKQMLYDFCAANRVGVERIGKLIVATSADQVGELEVIRAKARANGVEDLVLLSAAEAQALEPALACEAALLSPSTGIVDSHGFMLALQGELEAHGGQVVLNTPVEAVEALGGGGFRLTTGGAEGMEITCAELVIAAGHGAPGLAAGLVASLPDLAPPKAHFAKGSYFKLTGRAPFARLIYPMPEPGGLGVHLTLDLQHQARFGPDVEWVDARTLEEIDMRVDPARGDGFYGAIRRYWPDLADGALTPDYAGVRPKISGSGEAAADFRIDGAQSHGRDGLVLLYGIESPGLTASLALARIVSDHFC
ncbi:NAD(P)/FAD-dependent oxidoreductase [Roseibium aestuarii]|uniref:NAD(P)/FAD-dependent oxidoreductase n=1 Tax=Roseibium aestuarii TaxID=2600299 RepID=A0ABW4JPW9_9HYPH|nr:NAD(P)/FAD-dependent oxidoreductase [Roseibium aestuarii]